MRLGRSSGARRNAGRQLAAGVGEMNSSAALHLNGIVENECVTFRTSTEPESEPEHK